MNMCETLSVTDGEEVPDTYTKENLTSISSWNDLK